MAWTNITTERMAEFIFRHDVLPQVDAWNEGCDSSQELADTLETFAEDDADNAINFPFTRADLPGVNWYEIAKTIRS